MSLVGGKIVVMHVGNGGRTALESNVDTYSDGMWHYITVTKQGRTLVDCQFLLSLPSSGLMNM